MVGVLYPCPRWYHTYSTQRILGGVPESRGDIEWDMKRKQDGNVCASLLAVLHQPGDHAYICEQTQAGCLVYLLARRKTMRVMIDRHSLIWSVSMLTSERSIVAIELVPQVQPSRNDASGLNMQRQELR